MRTSVKGEVSGAHIYISFSVPSFKILVLAMSSRAFIQIRCLKAGLTDPLPLHLLLFLLPLPLEDVCLARSLATPTRHLSFLQLSNSLPPPRLLSIIRILPSFLLSLILTVPLQIRFSSSHILPVHSILMDILVPSNHTDRPGLGTTRTWPRMTNRCTLPRECPSLNTLRRLMFP